MLLDVGLVLAGLGLLLLGLIVVSVVLDPPPRRSIHQGRGPAPTASPPPQRQRFTPKRPGP